MAKTKIESARETKLNLSDLTNIPPQEFERHFRDWMERDDVARSLQAKLRSDLIANFNKTALGKHILAQTTTTTGGGATQRLTLCPLTLALNTLVAEFLYAGNCHFTLSVFCTEVPYRNILPDFESMRHFRFNEQEIGEILQAVSGDLTSTEKSLLTNIKLKYGASGDSLLMLIVQLLLARIKHPPGKAQPQSFLETPKATNDTGKTIGDTKDSSHEFKAEVYNSNFRYLNKYLIILSKKVNEMTQQFQSLQQNTQHRGATMRKRVLKTPQTRKFENLNRSLERITENLKLMSHTKRRSKHVGAIVSAIEGLALQFTKCAANFENVSRGLSAKTGAGVDAAARAGHAEKQAETQTIPVKEQKSYLDWVQEMRNTTNGQKFLDRIEIALRKALNKQRDQLAGETDMKLRHQKELLKIRYKQKLMEELTRHGHGSMEHSVETRKINDNIERKLQQFEDKHIELLQKIKETEAEVKRLPHRAVEAMVSEPSNVATETNKATTISQGPTPTLTKSAAKPVVKPTKIPMLKDAVNTKKQLQQIVQNMAIQERAVDNIVYDAKLRIQALENESNQLEQSFLNYLERQRMEKEVTTKTATKMWDYFTTERERMWQRFKVGNGVNVNSKKTPLIECRSAQGGGESEDEDLLLVQTQLKQLQQQNKHEQSNTPVEEKVQKDALHCRNAILEAKHTFFENKRRYKAQMERRLDLNEMLNEVEVVLDEEVALPKQTLTTMEGTTEQRLEKLADTLKSKAIKGGSALTVEDKLNPAAEHVINAPQTHAVNTEHSVKESKSTIAKATPEAVSLSESTIDLNTISITSSTPQKAKSTTVLKQSMAKMQMLFNDDTVTTAVDEKVYEPKLPSTLGTKSQLSALDAVSIGEEDQTLTAVNSALQGIAAMFINTTTVVTPTTSATPSTTSVHTITATTTITDSSSTMMPSMLEVIKLPTLMFHQESALVGIAENSSSSDTDAPTSFEVAAVIHAENEPPPILETDKVLDTMTRQLKLPPSTSETPEIGEVVDEQSRIPPAFTAVVQALKTSTKTSSTDESSIELQLSTAASHRKADNGGSGDSDFWAS